MLKFGKYQSQGSYKAFIPNKINAELKLDDPKIPLLLADAMRYLGELNAYSQLVPDMDFFIKMYVAKEATTSSRIEGTKTNIEEAIRAQDEISIEKRDDWEEVQNYIKAINHAIKSLERLPLSLRVIKETHKILLSGVRGYARAPGEIRKTQNWIGGSDINSAAFIPPPAQEVPELLSDLEKYWHNDELDTHPLIKSALIHYQFETIHPFLDGNGRIGRLLITLQLVDAKILTVPALYISDYFERNRASYYDALSRNRTSGDIEHWIRFFLTGVVKTAKDAQQTMRKIVQLREDYLDRINKGIGIRRQANAKRLLPHLFAQPIITVAEAQKLLNSSNQAAADLVADFQTIGLLREMTGLKTKRIYALDEYLKLFNKGEKRG